MTYERDEQDTLVMRVVGKHDETLKRAKATGGLIPPSSAVEVKK